MRDEAFEEEDCIVLYGFLDEMGWRGIYRREVNEIKTTGLITGGKEGFFVYFWMGIV